MSDTPRRGMIPADIFRLKLVGDAQISPDGQRVAYVVSQMDEEADEYRSAIWLVGTAEGSEARRFTHGPKRDGSPRWSPDGTHLAFISEREGKKPQIWVLPVEGGEARRVTDLPYPCTNPVWSPDGSKIAFTARVALPEPDEKEKEKSKPHRVIDTLRYKANGEGFIHDRRQHIFVVDVATGATKQITDGEVDDEFPTWSPDGTQIAFTSNRHADRDYDNVTDIYLVSPEGGELRRLTPGRGPVHMPAWSPDGALIAYAGNEYALDMGRNDRIYVIPATGGEPRCLTAGLDRNCTAMAPAIRPTWSADSRLIYFGIEDKGRVPVMQVAADGSTPPEVAVEDGGNWQVAAFSAAKDGTLAYTAMSGAYPAEVGAKNAAQGWERALTRFNHPLVEEIAFVQPEHFTFERDGFTIDGWVMKPANYEEGKRYPALLNVHGGPATQYGWAFHDEFQVYSGAGYAVIYTNPRGSQGYGEEFTRAVRGDWGGGDYADVMMGVDEALRRFDFIDPDRLGVMGGSYGGFMTSWTVGHTNRFKAACSERAVNNLHTLFGTSDIGFFFLETHAAGTLPWENLQWFTDHSPVTYVNNITTPLLIIHSENDIRCPIEQAEQLFVALKKLRREVLFVRFPDENHELSRSGRPRHRRDRFHVILDWFAKYLEPARITESTAVASPS